jgi:hypothetical protein
VENATAMISLAAMILLAQRSRAVRQHARFAVKS